MFLFQCGESINRQCSENNNLFCHLHYVGSYGGAVNLPLMLELDWCRDKVMWGKRHLFIPMRGTWNGVKYYAVKLYAEKDPSTDLLS
jgi:hypothetical protein